MKQDAGRVARTAGLVIMTSVTTAAIQATTWDAAFRCTVIFIVIIVGAFLASVASDFGGE